jgi:hypothetical protein
LLFNLETMNREICRFLPALDSSDLAP